MTGDNSINPLMADQLDQQTENWGPDFFWHRVRWKAVREQLPATGSFGLIDVGAGAGFAGEYLERDFPTASYSFVEPLETLERRLEARWGEQANLKDAPSFGACDFVCMLDVLEHIEDDQAFLGELATKMKSGDRLIILVPALQSLWSKWDELYGHFRRYDKRMIKELIAPLPFEIREQGYLFPEMLPAAWLRRRRSRESADRADGDLPPSISPALNLALFALSSLTLRLRNVSPRGTSLLAVLEKS
ncbi:MAG: methyltransferase domain-containing protein [Actinobacteria bacterium]|uniref:Unannotated protein n=1 Tax=freshwater metagenome TaxID=449393 RepID=A0A6J5ZY40_9ZZZZ|nr:methyltransferase domain-containing protein [Actinomycetota bacterium]